MKLKQSVKMAFGAIFANKMRSFLTMLGIIIGVFSVTLLVSIVQSGTNTITDSMSGLGGNQVTVTVTNQNRKLTRTELQEIVSIVLCKLRNRFLVQCIPSTSGCCVSQPGLTVKGAEHRFAA